MCDKEDTKKLDSCARRPVVATIKGYTRDGNISILSIVGIKITREDV